MLNRNLIKTSWCKLRERYVHKTVKLSKTDANDCKTTKIRNIGILAHIDAGKTTTTERMLFYSGLIKSMGEVHHGNTVTDYMEQERQRGITITSAAVSFAWKDYRFNLIDTPGHIDFTMEVEQTLRVLDGAIVIIDGSAGVEAQTLTVCRQADRYNVPRIIYVNKMDRSNGNFEMSIESIESKLNVDAIPIQIPIKENGVLEGVVDIITLEKLMFSSDSKGLNFTRIPLTENESGKLWEMALEKRRLITDKLSGLDDNLANAIIEQESLEKIPAQMLADSIRKTTVSKKVVPVVLGSSYKNVGVQPLMDAVILYLPAPDDNSYAIKHRCFHNNLSARVFKIVHDKQKGPVTFLRVYTGKLKKGEKIYNVQREVNEQATRLYIACADDYEEISEIDQGNIVAATGLKSTITGDLLTNSVSTLKNAKQIMQSKENIEQKAEDFFATSVKVPDPVFFCTIEPPSIAVQSALDTALEQLAREDPSLRVQQDIDTAQTVLAGMGELHIDIIKERIRTEYKIDADLGELQIAYKETIQKQVKDTFVSEHVIGKSKQSVTITMSLIPNYEGKEIFLIDRTRECASIIDNIKPKTMQAIKRGVEVGLLHGAKVSCPVIKVGVKLHSLLVGRVTSDIMVTATTSRCIRKLLQQGGTILLEPIMHLEIVTNEKYASAILADLARRRAEVQRVDVRGQDKVLDTLTPLSELMGYSTALRIASSGTATFSMQFDHYREMTPIDEEQAIRRIKGF